MEIHADRETCVGAGLCAASLPRVFDLDEEGKIVVIDEHPDEALRMAVVGAVQACPSFALALGDSEDRGEGSDPEGSTVT